MKTVVVFVHFSIVMSFSNFITEFNTNCSEYLKFEGGSGYMYLFKEEELLTLMLSHNNTSYEVYTYPAPQKFTFQWPENLVNDQQMYLTWQEGVIGMFNFTSYHINCSPTYFTTNLHTEPDCLTYKCPKANKDWQITSFCLLIVIIFVVTYATGEAVQGSHVPWFVRWVRAFLSRGQESPPNYYQGEDKQISEDSITLEFTQIPC